MGSFTRKLKRKHDLASKKVVKKHFKNMLKSTVDMEKKCMKCGKDFEEATKEDAMEWKVRYNGVKAELQCPVCFTAENPEE
jgi:DNA-directed RNA polymerase subunit RPC12/RpoP